MKKLVWMSFALILAACNASTLEDFSGGTLSFSVSEAKINVLGYFENAVTNEGDPFMQGFYYEYSEDEEGISENFYTLSNYQNVDNKVRVATDSWQFVGAYFASDGTDLLLNLSINNVGENSIDCSIEKVGSSWDNHYSLSLPNESIDSSESKTLKARISKSSALDSTSLNNGEAGLLNFKVTGEKGDLISNKQSIIKDTFTYDDFEREPASEVTGLIYGKTYTNMLGDMKKETLFEKTFADKAYINAYPHTDGSINDRETDATKVNFIKGHYYFFALDFDLVDFEINSLVTVQYHFVDESGSVNDRPVYTKVTDQRIIIICKYSLDVTDNVFFAMCFSTKNNDDVGVINYHSMLAMDLGESLTKTYLEYEEELTYFSLSKSTVVDVIYKEGEVERKILRFTYTKDKEYISFTYTHKVGGSLIFKTADGIEIDYSTSYLTYSYYSYN